MSGMESIKEKSLKREDAEPTTISVKKKVQVLKKIHDIYPTKKIKGEPKSVGVASGSQSAEVSKVKKKTANVVPVTKGKSLQKIKGSKTKCGAEKFRKKYELNQAYEVQNEIKRFLNCGIPSSSVLLKYNGVESLDELIAKVFTFPSPEDETFIKAIKSLQKTGIEVVNSPLHATVMNNSSNIDNIERTEKLYLKLRQELDEAGAFDGNEENVENQEKLDSSSRTKMNSTEELLNVLMADSSTLEDKEREKDPLADTEVVEQQIGSGLIDVVREVMEHPDKLGEGSNQGLDLFSDIPEIIEVEHADIEHPCKNAELVETSPQQLDVLNHVDFRCKTPELVELPHQDSALPLNNPQSVKLKPGLKIYLSKTPEKLREPAVTTNQEIKIPTNSSNSIPIVPIKLNPPVVDRLCSPKCNSTEEKIEENDSSSDEVIFLTEVCNTSPKICSMSSMNSNNVIQYVSGTRNEKEPVSDATTLVMKNQGTSDDGAKITLNSNSTREEIVEFPNPGFEDIPSVLDSSPVAVADIEPANLESASVMDSMDSNFVLDLVLNSVYVTDQAQIQRHRQMQLEMANLTRSVSSTIEPSISTIGSGGEDINKIGEYPSSDVDSYYSAETNLFANGEYNDGKNTAVDHDVSVGTLDVEKKENSDKIVSCPSTEIKDCVIEPVQLPASTQDSKEAAEKGVELAMNPVGPEISVDNQIETIGSASGRPTSSISISDMESGLSRSETMLESHSEINPSKSNVDAAQAENIQMSSVSGENSEEALRLKYGCKLMSVDIEPIPNIYMPKIKPISNSQNNKPAVTTTPASCFTANVPCKSIDTVEVIETDELSSTSSASLLEGRNSVELRPLRQEQALSSPTKRGRGRPPKTVSKLDDELASEPKSTGSPIVKRIRGRQPTNPAVSCTVEELPSETEPTISPVTNRGRTPVAAKAEKGRVGSKNNRAVVFPIETKQDDTESAVSAVVFVPEGQPEVDPIVEKPLVQIPCVTPLTEQIEEYKKSISMPRVRGVRGQSQPPKKETVTSVIRRGFLRRQSTSTDVHVNNSVNSSESVEAKAAAILEFPKKRLERQRPGPKSHKNILKSMVAEATKVAEDLPQKESDSSNSSQSTSSTDDSYVPFPSRVTPLTSAPTPTSSGNEEDYMVLPPFPPDSKSSKKKAATSIKAQPKKRRKLLPGKSKAIEDMKGIMLEDDDTPDLELLSKLMRETWDSRREYFAKNMWAVDAGMKKFPALKLYQVMKQEFNLQVGQIQGMERMAFLELKLEEALRNASSKTRKRPGQKRHDIWENALIKVKQDDVSPEQKKVLEMICLAFHLAENSAASKLFRLRKKKMVKPLFCTPILDIVESKIFDVESDIWIYADSMKCLKVPNFYEGVLTAYAMHYVFDIQYDEQLAELFSYFDNVALIV